MYRHFFKRFFDIILSFFAIIVFALPMVIIAIAVRCDSKGPALFKTRRVGKNCKPFKFYKFRSMRTDAPKDCAPRLLHEDYTTKVGAFLRKTSLDELPQLFCIFVGSMSVIGPRPAGLSETDLIEARERYGANGVRPGLTGWAQVNGRDVLASDVERKARFDGEYARKITFAKDFKIFFKTVGQVFRGTDIVEGDAVLKKDETPPAASEAEEQTPPADTEAEETQPSPTTSEEEEQTPLADTEAEEQPSTADTVEK